MDKQYCRYCAFLCYGDAPYCTDHDKVMSESTIKSVNHCSDFALSDLGDVETGRMYRPRKERVKTGLEGQIKMEGI